MSDEKKYPWGNIPIDVIKSQFAADATAAEFERFLAACVSFWANPFNNEIYCIVKKENSYNGKHFPQSVAVYPGINYFLRKAGEHHDFVHLRCQAVHEKDNFKYTAGKSEEIVHEIKFPRGKAVGVYAIASRKGKPDTFFVREITGFNTKSQKWGEESGTMLEARATGTVLRRAFPDMFAGLYAAEEIDEKGDSGPSAESQPAIPDPAPVPADDNAMTNSELIAEMRLFFKNDEEVMGYINSLVGAGKKKYTAIPTNLQTSSIQKIYEKFCGMKAEVEATAAADLENENAMAGDDISDGDDGVEYE